MAGPVENDYVCGFFGKQFTVGATGETFVKYTCLDEEGYRLEIRYNSKKGAAQAQGDTSLDDKPDFFLFKSKTPVASPRPKQQSTYKGTNAKL